MEAVRNTAGYPGSGEASPGKLPARRQPSPKGSPSRQNSPTKNDSARGEPLLRADRKSSPVARQRAVGSHSPASKPRVSQASPVPNWREIGTAYVDLHKSKSEPYSFFVEQPSRPEPAPEPDLDHQHRVDAMMEERRRLPAAAVRHRSGSPQSNGSKAASARSSPVARASSSPSSMYGQNPRDVRPQAGSCRAPASIVMHARGMVVAAAGSCRASVARRNSAPPSSDRASQGGLVVVAKAIGQRVMSVGRGQLRSSSPNNAAVPSRTGSPSHAANATPPTAARASSGGRCPGTPTRAGPGTPTRARPNITPRPPRSSTPGTPKQGAPGTPKSGAGTPKHGTPKSGTPKHAAPGTPQPGSRQTTPRLPARRSETPQRADGARSSTPQRAVPTARSQTPQLSRPTSHSPSARQRPVYSDQRQYSPAAGYRQASSDARPALDARPPSHYSPSAAHRPLSSDARSRVPTSAPGSARVPASPQVVARHVSPGPATPNMTPRCGPPSSAAASPHSAPRSVVSTPKVTPRSTPVVTSRATLQSSPQNDRARGLSYLEELLQPRRCAAQALAGKPMAPSRLLDGTFRPEEEVPFQEIKFREAIGAGSFGAVFLATWRGQDVAVKQCKVADQRDADMLLLEIRYLQALRHERLVSLLACCHKAPHVVMVMEFMPGGSLYSLLFSKKQKLSFDRSAKMGLQVCEGLTYLHSLYVVHRDLKTMNIVLDKALNCKICDFGLTVSLERSHLTVDRLQGSPRYLAPEQFEAAAKITLKVDIWQMGCIFLELFCQVIPFANATAVEQVATELLVRRRAPTAPASADGRARVLIHACLRLHANQRPTAPMLESALKAVHEAEPFRNF